MAVGKYPFSYPSRYISMYFRNCNIEEIEVRSVRTDEIPENIRNVQKQIADVIGSQ